MKDYNPNVPDSLLEEHGDDEHGMHNFTHKNFSLKSGVTIRCFEIEDDRNISKLGPEYDVAVLEYQGDKGSSMTIYKNCLAFDRFGGLADFFESKYRTPTEEKYESTLNGEKQDGSFVLLLCLYGQTEKAVILGGLRHPGRKDILTKEAGIHAEGEFNGINFKVNKDGELTLTYKSKTNNKGVPQDEEAGGTFVKMEKDGSIDLNDGNTENIRINKTDKKIAVNADSDIELTSASGSVKNKAGANFEVDATAELLAKAGGSAKLESGGAFDIKAGGAFGLKAPSGNMQFDSALMIKANAAQINATNVQLGAGGTPALIFSTQFLGIGNLGAPVVSQAIGPFSSVVFVAG